MDEINNQNMLQVGTILHGTYKIESYLSSGGFGNTYLAKNIEFDETYAIKEFFVKGVCQRDGNSTTISVSNAENTNSFEQQREKFKKEARRLRSLSNPHIVKVYDLFEENGTAYYVMDYVDGENLSARLKRTKTPLSETAVRNYLSQILDGLDAVHNAGMLHLDIKPANIMVDSHYVVKLIDFGASKQQSTVGGATASTGISYTNGYAPSEQMAQSYDKFGPWTDFYALGATLYKLLTNQDPPSVTDLSEDETEDKHLALPMPNVSDEMKKLVVWMMQVNRNLRPQNVQEIFNALSKDPQKASPNQQTTEGATVDRSEGKEHDKNAFWKSKSFVIATFCIVFVFTALCVLVSTKEKKVQKVKTSDSYTTEEKGNLDAETTVADTDVYYIKPAQESKNTPKETKKKTETPKDDNASLLKNALSSGNYKKVQQLANQGYAAAYGPLAKYYLQNNEYSLAESYAKKAKSAGFKEGNSVINALRNLGYYD